MWPARAGMLGKRIRGGQVEGRDFLMGAKEWGREDMSRVGRHARVVPIWIWRRRREEVAVFVG